MLQLIEISLICVGIHVCFLEGMIFESLRIEKYLVKLQWIIMPLYYCLPCMASFWTCIILWKIDIKSMLIVCGINAIIASVLQFFDNTKLPENE
jgi:hypothetical protein